MITRFAIAVLLLLTGCAGPPQVEQTKRDPTKEAAYTEAVERLAALNRKAEDFLKRGRPDDAAAAIVSGQPLQARVLAAPHPTLAAMEAASDRDDLYARMLLANHRDGWARTLFEKNAARWKMWRPQTDDTARRLRQAEAGMRECDRRLNGAAVPGR